MKAYVLAAGYATRLHPLTLHTPKPLLEIAGRPMLSHVLEQIIELEELSEIVVVANHRFIDAFHEWSQSVRCPCPMRVLDDGSTCDDDKLGAIGDLAFAFDAVPPGDEDCAIVAGDNWLGFDLCAAQREFVEQGRRPLLLLRHFAPVAGQSPYNEVRLDPEGRVIDFREKPVDPTSPWVAIAVYFFPPRVAAMLARYLEEGGNPDAPGFFAEWLVQHAPVRSHVFEGEWMDIGSPEALAEARRRFA